MTEVAIAAPRADAADTLFEVKDLKVRLGEQVQAGQALCTLADHQRLFVEGWAFKTEAKALAVAADEQLRIDVEFVDENPGDWPPLEPLVIHHLANQVDPVNRTFPFYLSLENQAQTIVREGKTYFAWRFRPGQRVRLRVPVEKLSTPGPDGKTEVNPFVLPAGAVVREGPEAFAFVQAGDVFTPGGACCEDRNEVVMPTTATSQAKWRCNRSRDQRYWRPQRRQTFHEPHLGAIGLLQHGAWWSRAKSRWGTARRGDVQSIVQAGRPRVTIMTECPGLAAEEVETLVTFPIESAVLGANGVRDVRTQSAAGLSSVVVEFDWNVEMRAARQTVQERLATIAGDLPDDARPQMAPPGAIMGQILLAGLRRSSGPNGGELVPVPGSTLLAERARKADGSLQLFAWKPTDRRDPRTGKPCLSQARRGPRPTTTATRPCARPLAANRSCSCSPPN